MDLPKFLLADCSSLPDDIFVLHTEYPKFLLNLATDEIEWFDDIEEDEEQDELVDIMSQLIKEANDFYESEIDEYQEND